MAFRRYQRDGIRSDGKCYASPGAVNTIRQGIISGDITIIKVMLLTQADRLDTLSGELYGDGQYWWIIAAASDIGWGLQVPPGTIIRVPDLKLVERLIG